MEAIQPAWNAESYYLLRVSCGSEHRLTRLRDPSLLTWHTLRAIGVFMFPHLDRWSDTPGFRVDILVRSSAAVANRKSPRR